MSLLIWIIVGALAGWIAGLVVSGRGFGLIGDIIVGIVGAIVAGWLFPRLGVSLGAGVISTIFSSAAGAIIVLVVIKLLRRV
ncbi:GlsB/YeaQ/YmgE family stress response membrane protein [Vineibacter terrae]|uniref:GlsB/YeaQ/YmgE family stress response membrane protein n=1 Tax=Vineibacter terrae TaxID=2586908 RepID=A0A5C8PLX1_9HYPH|nr:GlsB/YeaQ/YmgE family stress response membrane protein [Vineibacter terrae]TXL74821.1 GlsB/YeaQ/YmgE family stress response membrane protein [Vineibacter terrae]